MRLYGSDYSAYVARVRIGLAVKGLTHARAVLPPGGVRGEAFRALNPIGRVPVLELADGTTIAESETILIFLDEACPDPALMPPEPTRRAELRTVIRATENYLTPATHSLFPLRSARIRDNDAIAGAAGRVTEALKLLDELIPEPPEIEAALTLADCMVFPSLYLVELVAGQLELAGIFGRAARVVRYFESGKQHVLLGRIYRDSLADLVNA